MNLICRKAQKMAPYRKILPLIFLMVFFSQHICAADLPLFLNQVNTHRPTDFFALNEERQRHSSLPEMTPVHSEKATSTATPLDAVTLHKYLGYATVLLAGLAAISSSQDDAHYAAAYGTVAASVGTLTTGYMAHGDRFTFEDGIFTEDNTHILLGTVGALGCIAAVALADSGGGNSHDGIGVVGGGGMLLSVITIKW